MDLLIFALYPYYSEVCGKNILEGSEVMAVKMRAPFHGTFQGFIEFFYSVLEWTQNLLRIFVKIILCYFSDCNSSFIVKKENTLLCRLREGAVV